MSRIKSRLDPKKRYLQVALNSTLDDARTIIRDLPPSDRIIIEVGTPLIKRYGQDGIRTIVDMYQQHVWGLPTVAQEATLVGLLRVLASSSSAIPTAGRKIPSDGIAPYVVADLKTMDRGGTEVDIAANGGASAAVALGSAPIETLDAFIAACEARGLDAMIDMMNVAYPLSVLRQLKKVPPVVILHRGVDEEQFNKEKQIPLHEIRRIKGAFNILIAIAGGDTLREVQRSIFNDADIVIVWKSVYKDTKETVELIDGFLKAIR
jgi:bifunctional enzyme Fae/Hps